MRLVRWLVTVCLSIAGGISPADAQTSAAGPYYAVPSWDQKLACETLTNCSRFMVLSNWNNAAVLDRETGLVWQRAPFTNKTSLDLAEEICRAAAIGGRYGWRLPTQVELLTIGIPGDTSPLFHLPPGHPFNVNVADGTEFWSSEHDLRDANFGRGVNFRADLGFGIEPGVVTTGAPSSTRWRGWCVRGLRGEAQ